MNEWRDDWAQAFGENVGIVGIGFGLLGITRDHAARFRSAKRVLGSLRDHAALFLGERSMILSPREKKLLRRFPQGKTGQAAAAISIWRAKGTVLNAVQSGRCKSYRGCRKNHQRQMEAI
jgi:hypothetical protein